MEQKQNPRPQGASQAPRPAGQRPVQARPAGARPAGGPRPAQRRPQARQAVKKEFEMPAFIQRWQKKRAWRKKRIAQLTPKQLKVYKKRVWERRRRYISRAVLSVLTIVAVLLVTLLSACFVLFRGPSQS
ncbi:MAG: hypothetical protein J6M10_03340, partial [Clostridia bacterium]|nr:hypothetical protein [Clostridia bacterium]